MKRIGVTAGSLFLPRFNSMKEDFSIIYLNNTYGILHGVCMFAI